MKQTFGNFLMAHQVHDNDARPDYRVYVPELRVSKYKACAIANDLCYGKDVINKIQNATSNEQIVRIMHDARLSD